MPKSTASSGIKRLQRGLKLSSGLKQMTRQEAFLSDAKMYRGAPVYRKYDKQPQKTVNEMARDAHVELRTLGDPGASRDERIVQAGEIMNSLQELRKLSENLGKELTSNAGDAIVEAQISAVKEAVDEKAEYLRAALAKLTLNNKCYSRRDRFTKKMFESFEKVSGNPKEAFAWLGTYGWLREQLAIDSKLHPKQTDISHVSNVAADRRYYDEKVDLFAELAKEAGAKDIANSNFRYFDIDDVSTDALTNAMVSIFDKLSKRNLHAANMAEDDVGYARNTYPYLMNPDLYAAQLNIFGGGSVQPGSAGQDHWAPTTNLI